MRAKKLIMVVPILCLLCALCNVAYAAPVYIDTLADFPAYPYNSFTYEDPVDGFVGCGPTTGAMILGYFEHHFGATGLLDNPVAGVDEGLDTAWELHHNYMFTGSDGFGHLRYIKSGMEDYAEDRGYEIQVMVHYEIGIDPADVNPDYGAYGDGWTDDIDWWIDLAGDYYEIDDDKFCDYVEAKLTAGIAVWLSIDGGYWDEDLQVYLPTGYAGHWIPCVGVDKEAHTYYFYDTWFSSINSAEIASVGALAGSSRFAIGFLRTVEYIGPIMVEEVHDVAAVSQTVTENEVMPGDVVDIDVTVTNLGQFFETFDVTCYYDDVEIGIVLVVDLAPGETRVLTFTWDTNGVAMNEYHIKAWADSGQVIDEVDEDNNWCTMPLPILIIPEVPIGTILTVLSMFVALVGYARFKRPRTK